VAGAREEAAPEEVALVELEEVLEEVPDLPLAVVGSEVDASHL